MNQTEDIEFEIATALHGGPMTIAALEEERLGWLDDRRWLGVAIYRMLDDGRIETLDCDDGHDHDGACSIGLLEC